MPTFTSPWNLYIPSTTDGPPDTVTLGAMASSVNTALNTLDAKVVLGANLGVGTTTQMNAALASFPNGASWYNTTTSTTWRRVGGAWVNQDTGWVTPTFQNGWGGFARYRKDSANNLHIQARLSTVGTSSTSLPAFTLPAGFQITVTDFLRLPVGTNSLASNADAYYYNDGRVCISHSTPGYIAIGQTLSLA